MLNAKLLVVGGETNSGEFALRLPTTIGRGREATLTLPHPLVSRAHCEIHECDGKLVVKDLGSTNGTFVNNSRIEGQQVIEPGELLTLGNVTFRADYETGVEVDSAIETVFAAQPSDNQTEFIGDCLPLRVEVKTVASDEVSNKETVYGGDQNQGTDTDRGALAVTDL